MSLFVTRPEILDTIELTGTRSPCDRSLTNVRHFLGGVEPREGLLGQGVW